MDRYEIWRTAMKALALPAVVVLGLSGTGCTPSWAKSGATDVILLMTGINDGEPLDSDVRISSGSVCPDFVGLRLENHFKNPSVTNTGFRHDFTVERYEVRYFRSDGHNQPGVDVPYPITGNLATEVVEESAATLNLEVVRRQAKLEPPLSNLQGGGGLLVVTMFAEVTLHARTTTGDVTNPVSARLQIDFADFADTNESCPSQ
jgi:hypothetical protein